MIQLIKEFINGNESREAIDAARDFLKRYLEQRRNAGKAKGTGRKAQLNTPEAIANRERVRKFRANRKQRGETK